MAKSRKKPVETPETMDLGFSLPINRMEEFTLLLMDLGLIKSLEKTAMINKKTGEFEPLPFDIGKFWERYNDPDRVRFTEEKLDEYLASGLLKTIDGK